MTAYFDLWDTDSGNCLGSFATQDEALAIVAALLDANGDRYADDLDLGHVDEEDRFRRIATGSALAAMAREPNVQAVLLGTESDRI
jgi:hypothetical protein